MLMCLLKSFGYVVVLILITTGYCFATVIDFDSISATGYFDEVVPDTGRGPELILPEVTFDGGVVMSNDGWENLATTASNLYGTSDFARLNDGSLLPGSITAKFNTPITSLSLDVINGYFESDFYLKAFDASDNLLATTTVRLEDFENGSVRVGSVSLSIPSGFSSIKVLSSQNQGQIDFAIDTIEFNTTAIPEPATMLLFGSGLIGVLGLRRKCRK
jgi:hypothetical protein